jgi:zinc/manganese transport system substrate-binding protein
MIGPRTALVAIMALMSAAPAHAAKLEVVASFSILADLASCVGKTRVEIHTLVGANGDAHVFQPSSADAKAAAKAGVILINGLNFEPWAGRLVSSSGAKGEVVVVSRGVKPRKFADGGADDPHAWQDLANGQIYVRNIARAFAAADEAGAEFYRSNADGCVGDLARRDEDLKKAFAAIPKEKRRVITSHDAFGYFGAAYGIEFIAPLGISTEDQASAKSVARLIDQIKRERIFAVFVENITDRRLIAQIARETGARVGGELFSDALSKPGGPAATYTEMFDHNKSVLIAAMTASE